MSDLLSNDWQNFQFDSVELVETRPGAGRRQTFEKLQRSTSEKAVNQLARRRSHRPTEILTEHSPKNNNNNIHFTSTVQTNSQTSSVFNFNFNRWDLVIRAPAFTETENWPPNYNLDLNPVNYSDLLHTGCFTAACLPTAGSRHWAPEGCSDNKLGTDQPGLYWSTNRTVSETIGFNHCSEGRPLWTFFWLAVWLLSTCYISFAYVCDVYDITNENERCTLFCPTLYMFKNKILTAKISSVATKVPVCARRIGKIWHTFPIAM